MTWRTTHSTSSWRLGCAMPLALETKHGSRVERRPPRARAAIGARSGIASASQGDVGVAALKVTQATSVSPSDISVAGRYPCRGASGVADGISVSRRFGVAGGISASRRYRCRRRHLVVEALRCHGRYRCRTRYLWCPCQGNWFSAIHGADCASWPEFQSPHRFPLH